MMKTRHSLCSYTQNDSNVSVHTLQLIYVTHTYIAKTRLSFCTSTDLRDAVNQSIFRFIRSIYMHRNHIHDEDTTQSLLIYTEQQQRLCARAATHIRHSQSHCEGTTQLLRAYTSVRRSKSINFDFLIDLHASQAGNEIYLYEVLATNLLQAMLVRRAEQSHQHWQSSNSALPTRWAHTQSKSEAITTQSSTRWSSHIHRRTAMSLHICCNSHTRYTHILRRHDPAFAHIQTGVMQ